MQSHRWQKLVPLPKAQQEAEQRERLARLIKQLQPKATQRAIAKTLGVSKSQVPLEAEIAGMTKDKLRVVVLHVFV
jgi:hypothetical protein